MPIKISIVGSTVLANPPVLSKGKIGMQLSDRFASGEEAVRYIPSRNVDIALVNYELPCMDGFECARKLKAIQSDLPILMFTNGMPTHSRDEDFIFPALHAGANGYLPGNLPPMEMMNAIHQVHKAACCSRHLFLMFFESDRQLGRSAKYWEKIAGLLDSSVATIHYGNKWRKVIWPFKKAVKKSFTHSFVPLVKIPDRALATV